ncbi:unnamed protein product, partial [Vitis vinifera]
MQLCLISLSTLVHTLFLFIFISVPSKGLLASLELNDGSYPANLQVIVDAALVPLGQLVQISTCVHVESSLKVPPEGTKQRVEFRVEKVHHVGPVDPAKYPLPKTRLTLKFLRVFVHFRSRTNMIPAVARICNALAYATHTFFQNHGFLHAHTPIITTSDCEGAGEMFRVTTLISDAEKPGIPQKDGKIDYSQDFFVRQAFLTAIKLLDEVVKKDKKFENKVEWGIDLASEHERFSTEELFKKLVIVHDYLKGIKAFYMMLNDDMKTAAADKPLRQEVNIHYNSNSGNDSGNNSTEESSSPTDFDLHESLEPILLIQASLVKALHGHLWAIVPFPISPSLILKNILLNPFLQIIF